MIQISDSFLCELPLSETNTKSKTNTFKTKSVTKTNTLVGLAGHLNTTGTIKTKATDAAYRTPVYPKSFCYQKSPYRDREYGMYKNL